MKNTLCKRRVCNQWLFTTHNSINIAFACETTEFDEDFNKGKIRFKNCLNNETIYFSNFAEVQGAAELIAVQSKLPKPFLQGVCHA